MGGGDLNLKKSWHTGTLKNIERVWKKEQELKVEEAKLAELKKEMAQERAMEELHGLQVKAGLKSKSQKLDWMYAAGPNQSSSTRNADTEAFLLGTKRVDALLDSKDQKQIANPSDFQPISNINSKANSKRDIAAKVREDPLLAIKRREQKSIETIINNPMKMKEMEREKDKKKREKKEKKRLLKYGAGAEVADRDGRSGDHRRGRDEEETFARRRSPNDRDRDGRRHRARTPSLERRRRRSRSPRRSSPIKSESDGRHAANPEQRRRHGRSPSPRRNAALKQEPFDIHGGSSSWRDSTARFDRRSRSPPHRRRSRPPDRSRYDDGRRR